MKLAKCPVRSRARILSVDVDREFELRLRELGIRVGAELSVVNRAAFGGRVINIAGTRIAVDHRSSQRILVEDIAPSGSLR
ncbi:FeoA family protein [Actinomyces minihominis]|uniref:FeoA family protein n=1 Tax=Actinomyces minihominis TaxID=2002838 RepID=UPI000C086DC7|nr:FeoA family protein [Actinomyces minihominis]